MEKIIMDKETQAQLAGHFENSPCFYCDNRAVSVAIIPVDPKLYKGRESLSFALCGSCFANLENLDLGKLEMAALGEIHKHGI